MSERPPSPTPFPSSCPWHAIVFLSALGVQLTERAVAAGPTEKEQVFDSAGAVLASPAKDANACHVPSSSGTSRSEKPPLPTMWLVSRLEGAMYSTTKRLPATERLPLIELEPP